MEQMMKRLYLVGVALASKFSDSLDESVFLRAFALIFGSELGDKTFWMSAMFAAQHGRLVTSAAVLSVLALHNTAVCGHHNVIVV
jgi:putative Ca2+/H+ antiporter (TMEM165/GDT1 family)